MKILFHIEPLLFHGRPMHYGPLFDMCVQLMDPLRASDLADVRFISSPALIERAKGRHTFEPDHLYEISNSALRDASGLSAMDTLRAMHYGTSAELEARLAALYRDVLGDFEPDLALSISPAPYYKVAFPKIQVLHHELGLFSRAPLPHVCFLDSEGMFAKSGIGAHAEELLSLPVDEFDRVFVNLLRVEFRRRVRVNSSFGTLEEDLRSRFRRLLLLPLQFAGEFGFDLNCSYDRQGSFLLDVVERVSPDTAVIVAEHPTAIWLGDTIDNDTRRYVAARHPNVIFAPGAREGMHHAGQTLLHHVDVVASVSSSLGMQAAFFGVPLLSLGTSHLAEYATWRSVEEFDRDRDREAPDLTGALAWMMRHYYMPIQLTRNAEWFARYLAERVAGGPLHYPPFGADEQLIGALLTGTSIKAA